MTRKQILRGRHQARRYKFARYKGGYVPPDVYFDERNDAGPNLFSVPPPDAFTLGQAGLPKPKPYYPISPPDGFSTGQFGLPKPKPANLFRPATDPKTQAPFNRGEARRAGYKRKSDHDLQSDLGDYFDLQFNNRSDPLARISGFEVPELQPNLNGDVLIHQETQYKQEIDVQDHTPTPSKVRKVMDDCWGKACRQAIDAFAQG